MSAACGNQAIYAIMHMYPLPPKNEHVATEKGSSPKEIKNLPTTDFQGLCYSSVRGSVIAYLHKSS